MSLDIFVLDLETRSKDYNMREHAALEAWRVRQGKAEISSCDIRYPDGRIVQLVNDGVYEDFLNKLYHQLGKLEGKVVYAHNAVFDIGWLIASLQPQRCGPVPDVISKIQWRDSMLLYKWLINGQIAERSHFRLALQNLVEKFLDDHPDTPDFVKMKSMNVAAGENEEYWLERGTLDVKMTYALIEKVHHIVPESMRVGLMTEFKCLVPVANSWVTGFKIDKKVLEENEKYYREYKSRVAEELCKPEAMFSSPKQLGNFLFAELGIPPHELTPTGNPSTSSGSLKWMMYNANQRNNSRHADILSKILEAKDAATNYSKYVKTTIEALEHTGDGYIYSSPRLFGTYTGRMTYSNTVTNKDPDTDIRKKFKTSIAMHQIPRKATRVRKMLCAPDGFRISEFDAAAQESRLMALQSKDDTLLNIFKNGLNFHSMTGASIIGMDYDEFEKFRNEENGKGTFTESRQRGKLTNLACNFRISGRALAKQAFEKYDTMIDVSTGNHLVSTFVNSYPGVKGYWERSIMESRARGFSEALGGRRFKLSMWANERWGTESSAIMFPIQGSGAAMKEIAISELFAKLPEFNFALDLHDASFGYVKEELAEEIHKEAENILNSIDYSKYWGEKPSIDLPYDGMMGYNFADVK